MGKLSFKDSLKALEADIQHANTLALDHPRENDGARLQMRLSYSPAAQIFLFLVQWTDCNLAGALGLLRILIYLTYADGKTTMSVQERKASIGEFYGSGGLNRAPSVVVVLKGSILVTFGSIQTTLMLLIYPRLWFRIARGYSCTSISCPCSSRSCIYDL
ncbi:hypothetical protein NC651_002562 [Populus alba x Populus x berolinensis]|nr:hypothetical protein NC651_002562 [Populus alba x Populus x berolinensis]